MTTSCCVSNISYNSDAFFEATIRRLVEAGLIDWCHWIRHFADDDDTKDHIHFVLQPSCRLDLSALRKEFLEPDPVSTLPLCPTAKWFKTSSMDDWLLYAVHDNLYLSSKGLTRNLSYTFDDLHTTDIDTLRNDWSSIDRSKFDRLQYLLDAAVNHVPFALLVQLGRVPIAQRAQYEMQYNSLVEMLASPEGIPPALTQLLMQSKEKSPYHE